jgi:hypothetical protein
MDSFEQDLARMMRDSQEDTPYEDRHRHRPQPGVRARRRTWTTWMVTPVLTAAGLGVGLMVLPSTFAQGGSAGRQPRPVTSAESAPMLYRLSTPKPVPMPYRSPTPEPVPMPTKAQPAGSDSAGYAGWSPRRGRRAVAADVPRVSGHGRSGPAAS